MAVPLVVLVGMQGENFLWWAFGAFVLACLTDALDGFFARLWRYETRLGQFLDPVADKLLVASTLFLLVALERIHGIHTAAAIIILCRDILVSELREYLAQWDIPLLVTQWAKYKTVVQMTSLAFLLIPSNTPLYPTVWAPMGYLGLWISAAFSLGTGLHYLSKIIPQLHQKN